MVAQNTIFGFLAAAMIWSALRVVTTKNVVHAALYLVVVLAGVAGLFVLLGAEFIAATQVLVYIGAIVVLFLFGIMLTRAPLGDSEDLDNEQKPFAAIMSLLLAAGLAWTLYDAFGDHELPNNPPQRTAEVGNSIFQDFVVPFEVVSVLLLAALVGAVVIARRD